METHVSDILYARASSGFTIVHGFAGWLDKTGLDQLYRSATVVVGPSMVLEAFGLVGIEAMAYLKPIVAFDAGGVREWLSNGETGFLVEEGNIDGMAKRIDTLLESPRLARKMGMEGRRRVDAEFRRKIHLERLTAVYEEAIHDRVGGVSR